MTSQHFAYPLGEGNARPVFGVDVIGGVDQVGFGWIWVIASPGVNGRSVSHGVVRARQDDVRVIDGISQTVFGLDHVSARREGDDGELGVGELVAVFLEEFGRDPILERLRHEVIVQGAAPTLEGLQFLPGGQPLRQELFVHSR